jgi:uncharacterized protein involved in exopolysaccharide biosynthesis
MKPETEPRRLFNDADAGTTYPATIWKIARRRYRAWIALSIALFGLFSLFALYTYPQNYSSTVSIAMQQPAQNSSALLALTGNTTKKYTGVLKSRRFAEEVDKSVHFREVLGRKPTRKAYAETIEGVIKDLRVDDNSSDGLLYVTVNLGGPPRLQPDPGDKRRNGLRTAVAQAANLYAATLQNYLKDTDVDKELALLRAADGQVAQARQSYTDSIDRLGSFIRNTRIMAIPTGSSTSSTSTDTTGGSQAATLFGKRGELEAKMKSTDTLLSGTRNLLANPNQSLTALPEEDPLLVTARRQVIEAQANVDNLGITFGGSMQTVRRAKEQLKLAQDRLHREVTTILRGNTSEQLKRQALQTEYETVGRQIDTAEKNFQYNRNLAVDLEKLRNEVMLKLETLKTILTRYAELKMQTVSAQNRMVVVDEARPPMFGTPGIALLLAVSALATFFLVALWWTIEYLITSQKALLQDPLARE